MTTSPPPLLRRPRRRASLPLAALFAVAALSLSGCGASAESDGSSGFRLSYPATENSPYAKLAEMYMADHPDVKVAIDPIPAESYDDLVRTQLQAGNAADVVMAVPGAGSPAATISLADAGLISPLDGSSSHLVDADSRPLFFVGDEQYGQPTDVSITATVFNTAPGVTLPEGVDQLLPLCTQLAGEQKALFAVAGTIPINTGLMAVVIAGSHVYAQDPDWDAQRAAGAVTFAGTPGWRATLQLIVDMKDAGCFPPGAESGDFGTMVGGIAQGAALGAFVPGGAASDMAAGMPNAVLSVEAFPAPSGSKRFLFASSDYALVIPKASSRKAAAQAFLTWLAEPENSAAYAQAAGSLPVAGLDGVDLDGTVYAGVADLIAAHDYTTLPVNVWKNPAVFLALGSGVQALLTGQMTADQVLSAMDQAWGE